MGPKKVTAASRAQEFSKDFVLDSGKLMCRFCNHSINYQNKAFITAHINSKVHNNKREAYLNSRNKTRQQCLPSSLTAADKKKEIICDLVTAWVEADIPIEKLDKFRSFLNMYCKEGGCIPSAGTLHRSYLPKVFDEHLKDLRCIFSEKPIAIIIDETTDVKGRSVVNTLFSYQGITKLISVDYLQQVNYSTIGGLVLCLLTEWNISFTLPKLFVTDSASYMKKCFREAISPVMQQLKHNTCPAHIVNLIGESWLSIFHFDLVKTFISNIKKTFVHSIARRSRYMNCLMRHGLDQQSSPSLKFIPLPAATRWDTWFRMAFYVHNYLGYMQEFYNYELQIEPSETIKKIVDVFNNPDESGRVRIYLTFIQHYAEKFISDLKFFQKENEPVIPYVESRIQQLESFLKSGELNTDFGGEVNSCITNLGSDPSLFNGVFQMAFTSAYTKFNNHFLHHPSRSLFIAVQIFDPRFVKLTIANRNIQNYSTQIFELKDPSDALLREWSFYCNLDLTLVEFNNLGEFWDKISSSLPLLSKIALIYIWLPISSCAVERSFSVYNNVLEDDRQNLSEDSLKMLNMLYFNQRK